MKKLLGFVGGLFGLLAIVLGAFAAHALKNKINADLLEAFKTGVQYQFYHALTLLFLSISADSNSHQSIKIAGVLLIAGTVLFSCSLYLLALTGIKTIGIVTPIGGVLLIAGWIALIITQLYKPSHSVRR